MYLCRKLSSRMSGLMKVAESLSHCCRLVLIRIFSCRYQQLIKENLSEIAKLITLEQGKTLPDAEGDVMRGLQVILLQNF
jgi:hypothetical protein